MRDLLFDQEALLSFASQFRPLRSMLALVMTAALVTAGAAEARRARSCAPYPTFREPREGLHLLKDVYNPTVRHEQGEVRETFQRMSRDALSYFKGALVVFYHDLFDARMPWAREPVGPDALILGDAHIQNLGTVRDGRGVLAYDWLRYDHATQGPIMLDVRRLLVSLVLLADEISADEVDIDALLSETIRSYRESVLRLSRDPAACNLALSMENATAFVRKMLRNASRLIRTDLLARWTVLSSHGRRFITQGDFQSIEPAHRDAFEHALMHLNMAGRPPCFFRVKDATHRVYDGRGCRGHERIYLLVEGPTPCPDDDLILEASMKPIPSLPHFLRSASPATADQTARVMQVARALRRSPEPYLARITVGRDAYVVEEVQPWETVLSTEDLETTADLFDLARASALLLARAHVLTAASPEKLAAFVWSWIRRCSAIEPSLVAFARRYADQMHAEHAVFRSHVAVKPLLVIPDCKRRGGCKSCRRCRAARR